MESIKVHADGWGFEGAETGQLFVPVGCNYFDPTVGWPPKIWSQFDADRVRLQLDQLQALGVNTVRIVISPGYFMPQLGEWNSAHLQKLEAMVDMGRARDIRFILTSLDWWDGWPKWLPGDVFINRDLRTPQAIWYEKLYAHFRGDGAIFAADIRNEPQIGWASEEMLQAWRAWLGTPEAAALLGDRLPDTTAALSLPPDQPAPFDARLYSYQRFRESVAAEWVRDNAAAIRRGDPQRLVTVGLVQWSFPFANSPRGYAAFNPQDVAPYLDYLSAHFYPIMPHQRRLTEEWDLMQRYGLAWVRYAYAAGKPLVLQEFGWYGGGEMNGIFYSQEDLANWNRGLIELTRDSACGWLSWAYGDCPPAPDCTRFGGLVTVDGQRKLWGESFAQMAPDLKRNLVSRAVARTSVPLNMQELLTSLGEKPTMYETGCLARVLQALTDADQPWDFAVER